MAHRPSHLPGRAGHHDDQCSVVRQSGAAWQSRSPEAACHGVPAAPPGPDRFPGPPRERAGQALRGAVRTPRASAAARRGSRKKTAARPRPRGPELGGRDDRRNDDWPPCTMRPRARATGPGPGRGPRGVRRRPASGHVALFGRGRAAGLAPAPRAAQAAPPEPVR